MPNCYLYLAFTSKVLSIPKETLIGIPSRALLLTLSPMLLSNLILIFFKPCFFPSLISSLAILSWFLFIVLFQRLTPPANPSIANGTPAKIAGGNKSPSPVIVPVDAAIWAPIDVVVAIAAIENPAEFRKYAVLFLPFFVVKSKSLDFLFFMIFNKPYLFWNLEFLEQCLKVYKPRYINFLFTYLFKTMIFRLGMV